MWRWFSLKRIAPGARLTSTPWRSAPHLLDKPNPGILAPRMSTAGQRAAKPAGARRPWWIGPSGQTHEERMTGDPRHQLKWRIARASHAAEMVGHGKDVLVAAAAEVHHHQ